MAGLSPIALFILFIPLFTIGWNTWKIIVYYRRTNRFIKVTGTVIGTDITTGSGGLDVNSGRARYYAPVVEYTTKDNITYKGIYSEDNPDRPLYNAGEKVTICYDPVIPGKFIIYDPKAEYLVAAAWILVGLGGIFTIFYLSKYGGTE